MRARHLFVLALVLVTPARASFAGKSPKRKPAKKAGGGGFGSAPVAKLPKLDAKAKKLLQQLDGNVDAAQEQHFQGALQRLSRDDPALFDELMGADGGLPTGAAHAKLVELFWDAVAVYMPARKRAVDGGLGAKMRAKVEAIAGCATASGPAVLDVGCGDGAMLPHLLRAGAAKAQYLGLDVSPRMVELASAAHPGAAFRAAEFLDLTPTADAPYDCCLLNGASQFFADQQALVAAAAAWVRPGGRVVLSHAQGAAFVADEHRGNPAVARSPLPDPLQLKDLAEALAMELLPAEECVAGGLVAGEQHTLEGESFYLVALQKAG